MSVDDLMGEYGVEGSVNKRKVDTYRGKSVKEYRTVFNELITKGIEYGLDVFNSEDGTSDKKYTVNQKNLFRIVSIKGLFYWEIRIRHRGEYLKIDGKNNYFYLKIGNESDVTLSEGRMEDIVKFCDKLNGKILNGDVDTRIEQYIKSVKKNGSKSKKSKSTKEVTQSE